MTRPDPREQPPVYLSDDPERCICRGKGEYWAVGETPVVYNVFSVYPDMPALDQLLVACPKHIRMALTFADHDMFRACGIAVASWPQFEIKG